MATETVTLQHTRGDSLLLAGTLTPAPGRTFATPASSLRFVARRNLGDPTIAIAKAIGSGISISAQSSTSISYEVTLDPEDTSALDAREVRLVWDLELIEGDGWTSTPIGGVLVVRPDVV